MFAGWDSRVPGAFRHLKSDGSCYPNIGVQIQVKAKRRTVRKRKVEQIQAEQEVKQELHQEIQGRRGQTLECYVNDLTLKVFCFIHLLRHVINEHFLRIHSRAKTK